MKNLHLSAQESSTLNPILPGFLFRLLSWHTRTNTPQKITRKQEKKKSLKQSCGITEVTCVVVTGSLMPLVPGNQRAFGDPLAKTRIILSRVPPCTRLFCSCPISMWIPWLFLVASAYSLGQWGDRAAPGMNT